MTTPFKCTARVRWLALPALLFAHAGPLLAGVSPGQVRVGLTLVADPSAEPAPLPAPSALDHPASPRAVLCRSDGHGYRECRTPFRGPVQLSREVGGSGCVENGNWGWREGAVWVDHGCSAVFVRTGDA